MEKMMSDSKISFHVSLMAVDNEEVQQYHADHGFPLDHMVDINVTFDSGIAWPKLLETACEAIGAYYGYDVKCYLISNQHLTLRMSGVCFNRTSASVRS